MSLHKTVDPALSNPQIPDSKACRACEARGGCLAEKMMANAGQAVLVQKNGRALKRGEHLFRETDESAALYVVKSGAVKSYVITEDGVEQVLGFYMPGDVLGLDGLSKYRQTSAAVALESSSVCMLPFRRLSAIGQSHDFPQLVAEQMSRNHNLILMLARKDADGRLASFLCDLSQRYKSHGYSSLEFNLSMSRQDIGSYLGLAIETVSRTLTRFHESGLLEVNRRRVSIQNAKTLKTIAGAQVSS